ncbi:MAG: hypothetical protein KDD28_15385 [Phaeodactylibacter sp.]|nr:hypothetical protein [Phaeodactylibacter sp.]
MANTRYTIPKGRHKSRPFVLDSIRPRHKVESRVFEAVLGKGCAYVFKKGDGTIHPNQWDFSKLRGNSHCLMTNHQNAYMGAWRYNPIETCHELTSYLHRGGERFIGPNRVLITEEDKQAPSAFAAQGFTSEFHFKLLQVDIMATAEIGEAFQYRLLTDWDEMLFGVGFKTRSTGNRWEDDWFAIPEANAITRDILHWFGGDFSAPHKMKIQEWKI